MRDWRGKKKRKNRMSGAEIACAGGLAGKNARRRVTGAGAERVLHLHEIPGCSHGVYSLRSAALRLKPHYIFLALV